MSRGAVLRAAFIITLVLPGLVAAMPFAGPCDQSGHGDGCVCAPAVETASETHGCCEEGAAKPEPAPILGDPACACGSAQTQAVAEVSSPTPSKISPTFERCEALHRASSGRGPAADHNASPAPPPAPAVFLLDCAFLT